MSKVKRLIIQGVRSFEASDQGQIIEFFSPLTLIVGQNGCGKTSIIESLKYALTGEFPPGTNKGHSFINDPKMTGTYEVNALVKLEVVNTKGEVFIVTKRIRATQVGKGNNITLKAIEGTIHRKPVEGPIVQISGKCLDIKEEMCRIMGVSDAILNNVIFCHQEDSCWPLDEGKKVKEKFDAIFNTTNYNKCFEHLSKIDKKIGNDVKVQKDNLNHVKNTMLLAREKREQLEDLNIKLEIDQEQLTKYEKELEELGGKLKKLEELQNKYNRIASQVSQSKGKIQNIEEEMTRLKKNIKEPFDGSIEELKDTLSKFAAEHEEKVKELNMIEKNLKIKTGELIRFNSNKDKFIKDEGIFEKREKDNEQKVDAMKDLIGSVEGIVKKIKENTSSQEFSAPLDSFLDIYGSTDDKSKMDFSLINKTLKLVVKSKEQEVSRIKAQFDGQEQEIQKKVDEIKAKRTSLETEIEMKEGTIAENKLEIEDLRKRLLSIEGSQETLALLDDDERQLTEKIEAIEKSGILTKCEEEVKVINEEIKGLEEKLQAANECIGILTTDKNRSEKISIFTKQKIQKNKDCTEIIGLAEDKLRAVLGDFNVEDENLGKSLDVKIKEFRKEIKDKEIEVRKRDYEIAKCDSELKQVKKELENKEAQLEEWQVQVMESLEGRSFDVFYKEVSEKLENLQKKDYYSDASQYLLKKYSDKLDDKACCPLCRRDFPNDEEVKALKENLASQIDNIAKTSPGDKAMIQKMKQTNKSLQEMKPLWEVQKKLENIEIPELKKKRDELEEKLAKLRETAEELTDSLNFVKTHLAIASDLTKNMGLYDQNKREIKKIEDCIAKIEKERDPKAKELEMNLPEAQLEAGDVQGRIKSKRLEKENKEDMRNKKRNELAKNQQERNKVREDKLMITSELQNREARADRKKELEETNRGLQDQIQEMTKTLPSFKSEIAVQEKARGECLKAKEEQIAAVRHEKEMIDRQFSKINELRHQIEEFEVHKARHLDNMAKYEETKAKINEAEAKKKEFLEQMDGLKGEISNADFKKRDLNDSLVLKQREQEIVKFREELSNYEKLLEETKNQGVSAEIRELNSKYNEFSAKMNETKGSRKAKLASQRVLEHELNKPPLNSADADYREKLVRKTVYEKAVTDLRIYRKALDIAIVEFHKKRMEAINRKLKELWRKIYKGNDIDYIEIKCDDEEAEAKTSVKVEVSARKSYNYRVIMVRRGIELDMRSRCSAGQKILASLIIRIALAEAFSAKCGIITLDEPTTNLDQLNINALADTLANISVSMADSKTFQLLLITHDESFIERLLRIDPVEMYYKVSRNRMGYSQIRQYLKE